MTSSIRQTRSPGSKEPFEAVGGAVLLGFLADDHERQAGDKRRRGAIATAQARARQAHCVRLVLGHERCQLLSERLQQLGLVSKRYLSRVVGRVATGAKHEIALEVGGLADPRRELVAFTALPAALRARWITTAASGEPPAIETMEPSSK